MAFRGTNADRVILHPGALASFAGKLAANEINITLGYQTSLKGSKKGNVVLAVSDLEKADHVR